MIHFTSIREGQPHLYGSQVLNRHQAKSKLKQLTPGSSEHSQLQQALMKATGIVEIVLPKMSYKVDTQRRPPCMRGGFGASEHMTIGRQVKLEGFEGEDPVPLITKKGGVGIYFYQIIALAGDFYGVEGKPISLGAQSDQEKTQRFEKAFATLNDADAIELKAVLHELDEEFNAVCTSGLPHHCYGSRLMTEGRVIQKIKNDVGRLLEDNSDHFSTHAIEAYRIGHNIALNRARSAGQSSDLEGLKQAYALEAFACHFLTDLFSAGHIRNQRGELELFLLELGVPPSVPALGCLAKRMAGVLTGAQHEKDGNEGLNVVNERGDAWKAYGDGSYFMPHNEENRKKVIEALQASINEIYQAFKYHDNASIHGSNLSPTLASIIPRQDRWNPPALYTIEGSSPREFRLFVQQGSKKIEIKSVADYLTIALPLALSILPETYIKEYLPDAMIKSWLNLYAITESPLVNKVIVPIVERLTGSIWTMMGQASHYQVRRGFEVVHAQVEELAVWTRANHEKSELILAQLVEINKTLDQVAWDNLFRDIAGMIRSIETVISARKHYGDLHNLKDAADKLWIAHQSLLSVFTSDEGVRLLQVYAKELKKKNSALTDRGVQVSTTMWFRLMLDWQVLAVHKCFELRLLDEGEAFERIAQDLLFRFESSIVSQVNHNADHIDQKLILEKRDYIRLQEEKYAAICSVRKILRGSDNE